jgi:hypothetical protein
MLDNHQQLLMKTNQLWLKPKLALEVYLVSFFSPLYELQSAVVITESSFIT